MSEVDQKEQAQNDQLAQGIAHKDTDLLRYGYYLVAFIDLLGQREALRKFRGLPDVNNKEQVDKCIAFLQDSIGTADYFHKEFQNFFDRYIAQGEGSSLNKDLMTSNSIKFRRSPDGVMIFVSLEEPENRPQINAVCGVLGACASIFLLFLSAGKPMRGGIEIGTGVELNDNELFGPAVAEAYELESEVAQYPRIVVGKELVNYIRMHCRPKGVDIISMADAEFANMCLNMLIVDTDGYIIVDYLGKEFREAFAGELGPDIPLKAFRFVTQETEKWCRRKKDTKLAARYKRLRKYFNAKISLWK